MLFIIRRQNGVVKPRGRPLYAELRENPVCHVVRHQQGLNQQGVVQRDVFFILPGQTVHRMA